MKKLLFVLIAFILLAVGIFYYISNQKPALDQPIIPQEEDVETIEEIETEDSEPVDETGEQTGEQSFSERLTIALQETMDRIFQQDFSIVAIGDSLTKGVGDRTGGGGYVGILERTLNQEKHVATFENFGKSGNRSEQLLGRLDEPEVKGSLEEADMILITIGANDIMRVARENFTNLVIDDFIEGREDYERKLGHILETMTNFNANAEIYLLGIYNPFEQYFQDIEELNQIVDAWNETGKELSEERDNVTFIPIADLFSGNTEPIFAEDNFHPNYEGYYLMAERVLDYISREEG